MERRRRRRRRRRREEKDIIRERWRGLCPSFPFFVFSFLLFLDIFFFPKVILGDFNALRRADYSDERWRFFQAHDSFREVLSFLYLHPPSSPPPLLLLFLLPSSSSLVDDIP